jgi:tetratricopeptide (TPR) repeat protein
MQNRVKLPLTVVACISLSLSVYAQQLAPGGGPSSNAADEAALRVLVVNYYKAYAKKDLDALTSLWSKDSPTAASRRDLLGRMFAIEEYKFSEPAITRIKIEGGNASARVAVERDATSIRGSTITGRKSSIRADFSFVRERGEWKFWSETPAVVGMTTALASAKSDAERESLLEADKDLITRDLMIALNSQSDRAFAMAEYPRALSILISQRLVAEKLGDRKEVSHAWMNMGIIYFMQRAYQQALDAYQKGLAIEEELGRKSESAAFLTSIGLVQSALGKPKPAIEYFERGLAIHEQLNERASVAQALENIGNVHYEQGDYPLATDFYRKSLKWLDDNGSKSAYAHRLLKIAKTEYEQGSDVAAIDAYAEAANKFESAGDKRSIGYALHNIANIYYSQGDYAQAMNYYRRSLAAEKAAGTRKGVALALQGIGLIQSLDGNSAAALETYRENLAVTEPLGDKADTAAAWQKVGNALFSLTRFDQALEAFQRALTLRKEVADPQETASALVDVGVTYAAKADFPDALDAYTKSKALYESLNNWSGIAGVLLQESLISYSEQDYAKTLDLADKAAKFAKSDRDLDLFWQARYRAGKAHYQSAKFDLARLAFVEAIETIETMRPRQNRGMQPRFFESKIAPYLAMVDVAIKESKGNEAFDYAERAKSRVLLGVLQSAKIWINKLMTQNERERERNFLTDIASLNTQIYREQERKGPTGARFEELRAKLKKAENDYAAFRNRLFALHPQLKTLRGEAKPFNAAQSAALLTDIKTGLLEFVETDENAYLFAFSKSQSAARTQRAKASQPESPLKIYVLSTNRGDLYARITKFQEAIATRSEDVQVRARELYDLMLKPAEEQLSSLKHLVIAPDAVSGNLPFHALQAENGRYLIETSAVSYTPSLTALGAISKLRVRPAPGAAASPAILALINPTLNPAAEDRIKSILPPGSADQSSNTRDESAKNESEGLSRLYGDRKAAVLVGADATEERLKAEASRFQVLHLNVRGALNETAPLFSFTAMSSNPASHEDGLLEVREIFALDLKSDLVVMPEVELAWPNAGAIRTMTGLSWAWFVAGCPVSVVSRWRSEGASDLTLEFYRRVKDSWRKESKSKAWQAAVQQSLGRENRRHPYFWAGFAMMGDAR